VREKDTIFLNPGSTTMPKGKDPASAAGVDEKEIRIMTLEGRILRSEKW
jgi:predicted phosphodiesterase